MTLTDQLFIVFLVILTTRGACKGFLRSLIGPACFIISIILALCWYKITGKLTSSAVIILTGPFILGWGINVILEAAAAPTKSCTIAWQSRLGGALVHLIWGTSVCLALIGAAVSSPLNMIGLGDLTDNILASKAYRIVQGPLEHAGIIPPSEIRQCLDDVCGGPAETASLDTDPQLLALIENPAFKKLLSDPSVLGAIEQKNFHELLADPRIMELHKDPAFVKKLLRLYPKIRNQLQH